MRARSSSTGSSWRRRGSPISEPYAVPTPRITPFDGVLPELLAYHLARSKFYASFGVVDEIIAFQSVHFRRADIETRLQLAALAELRVHFNELLLVSGELVDTEPIIHAQSLFRGALLLHHRNGTDVTS